jgi:prephenate dehydratase
MEVIKMKIAYLGPKGTFTEDAAKMAAERLDRAELVQRESIEAVARSVAGMEAELGVMACYNYLEGLVQECLDLIYENSLKIVGAERVYVKFAVGMKNGNADFSRVYSHPKALAQCSNYLFQNYPDARQVPVASTSKAIEECVNNSGLAIAKKEAFKNIAVLAEDVGNKKHGRKNFTDFYVVAKYYCNESPENPLTMVAITPRIDRPRLLHDLLGRIDLNIEKIHSRPAIDEVNLGSNGEPQMFYIEIAGSMESDAFKKCMEEINALEKGKITARILGSYERQGS